MAKAQPIESPVVSTRNHFDSTTGTLLSGHDATDYESLHIPGLEQGTDCPPEIAIYVHGIWVGDPPSQNSLEEPDEIFDRARKSLMQNGYEIPLVGFSWDSDTPITINGSGWYTAQTIANQTGPKLAHFISDFKNECEDAKIRIIAHSLGARVVLSTLQGLHEDPDSLWNNGDFRIETIHFMGAAVDNEEVSKYESLTHDSPRDDDIVYGNAIEAEVNKFYNLYNFEDNVLEPLPGYFHPVYYPFYEGDYALGDLGVDPDMTSSDEPANYEERNVWREMPVIQDADGDGSCDLRYLAALVDGTPDYANCTIQWRGDNHFGYVGFRDRNGTFEDFSDDILLDDGAMDKVVSDWLTT